LDQAKAISCPVCLVFGKPAGEKLMIGPSRLVVRDATVTDKAMEKVTAGSAVELKTENVINRLRGAAEHPRTFERVSRGMDFNLEMVYSVYDLGSGPKTDFDNAAVVFKAMRLLEESYLGGSGSRGYGKVKFEDLEFTWRPLSSLGGAEPPARKVESLDKAEETLKELIGAK
jgi:CRISPR-associated protein Csm3